MKGILLFSLGSACTWAAVAAIGFTLYKGDLLMVFHQYKSMTPVCLILPKVGEVK